MSDPNLKRSGKFGMFFSFDFTSLKSFSFRDPPLVPALRNKTIPRRGWAKIKAFVNMRVSYTASRTKST